jgi:hypothetical protein
MLIDETGLEKKLEPPLDINAVCIGDCVRFKYPLGEHLIIRMGYVFEIRAGCFYMTLFDVRNIPGYHPIAEKYEMKKVREYTVLVKDTSK